MVSLFSLLLPILVSSVIVFIVSAAMHMLLTHHNSDFKKVPGEDKVMDDLRKANIPPGDYVMPFCTDNKERKSEAFQDKYKRGPVIMMTVFPSGINKMGSSLAQWFVFLLIVGIFAAYVSGRALPVGAHYLQVFRFAGVTAFIGHGLALMHDSIWYGKSWTATIKSMFDGLIYALLTAGVFGWLWPVA